MSRSPKTPSQVKTALGAVLRESEAKALPCGVFGSFGWSGEAVDEMEARLRDAGFKFGFDAIRVKFKPTAGQLQVRRRGVMLVVRGCGG